MLLTVIPLILIFSFPVSVLQTPLLTRAQDAGSARAPPADPLSDPGGDLHLPRGLAQDQADDGGQEGEGGRGSV